MIGLSQKTIALLGYGGAVPFLFLGGLVLLGKTQMITGFVPAGQMLLGYGAIILSFLGGLHWGRLAAGRHQPARSDNGWLVFSVIPPLLGWLVLIWPLALPAGAGLLGLGFGLCWFLDQRLVRTGQWSPFMGRLRLHLSFCALLAMICLLIAG